MKAEEHAVEQPVDNQGANSGGDTEGEEQLVNDGLEAEDSPKIHEEDDWWVEHLYIEKKDDIKEDNLEEKEDDLGIEDDLWVSLLYTDVDYSLLDTPTSLNGGRAVTIHRDSSRRSALVEEPTNHTSEK